MTSQLCEGLTQLGIVTVSVLTVSRTRGNDACLLRRAEGGQSSSATNDRTCSSTCIQGGYTARTGETAVKQPGIVPAVREHGGRLFSTLVTP